LFYHAKPIGGVCFHIPVDTIIGESAMHSNGFVGSRAAPRAARVIGKG